jgi:hypothetical protein
MLTRCALTCFAVLLLTLPGCPPQERALPDPRIPHRLAGDVDAKEWVRKPDGSFEQQPVRIPDGWWIAAPNIVEPPPSPTPGP